MKKQLISTLCLLFCTIIMMAQGSVRGKVLDKQTDEALQFVNIRITQGERLVKGAITDGGGHFNITGLALGNYVLTVSYVGYKDVTRKFSITDKERNVHFN